MTESGPIVGRGTRVHEETGKRHVTLTDSRGSGDQSADPGSDGRSVRIGMGPEQDMSGVNAGEFMR